MKTILSLIGFLLAAILVLALGSGLVVLLAYAVGWLANLLMKLESFQATALGLAGIFVFIVLADRVFHALTPLSPPVDDFDLDDEDEFEDDDDLFIIDEEQEKLDKIYAGIPRWRRPAKNPDFSNVDPNDRCPCGSGRKYKNCHGAKGGAH